MKQDYIAGDLHERYPNSAQARMPVAALCAKLVRGKILRDSVVLITSRPDESDKMSRIRFDRMVEITGFSEAEVKEYIEKYFRKDVAMKKTVLEHITKNENLVSFAHIPVLCALMCSYMEYMIKETNGTEDLPVSTSELYFEVLTIFELKHNKSTSSYFDETALDKLSEFAARLLLEKKFLFSDRDMKKLTSQEVESLRTSGLLHCGPSFRVSFSQTTKHYCFTHLTLHEYSAARWFVNRRDIPARETVSGMVLQFMAGILSKEKDSELMKTLLRGLLPAHHGLLLLEAKCLYEYQDEVFAKDHYRQYPFRDNRIEFSQINDVDCIALSFCLDILSALNHETAAAKRQTSSEQPFVVGNKALVISLSNLTVSGVKCVCTSLEKDFSDITELSLFSGQITSAGFASLCEALKHPSCKVTTLDLFGSKALVISLSNLTVSGVKRVCTSLEKDFSDITELSLFSGQITSAGFASLCEALKHPNCKVITLTLSDNQITDAGVASVCEALKHPSCKVTTLHLIGSQITDAGVASLCEALKHPSCKVTTLDLAENRITDAGVASLCEALKHPSCKVSTLSLLLNFDISKEQNESIRNALKEHKPGFKLYT